MPNNPTNARSASSISSTGYNSTGNKTQSFETTKKSSSIACVIAGETVTASDRIARATVQILMVSLIPIFLAACNQQPMPPVQVTIQIPEAVTNFVKPRIVQPDPDPDFQIVHVGSQNLQKTILLERHSGRAWQYIRFAGETKDDPATPGWLPIRYWEYKDKEGKKEPLDFSDITAEEFLNGYGPTNRPSAREFLNAPDTNEVKNP